ncbi:hypothetical protein B0T14DRAFT_428062 [Immersiella caudata]|uniref:Major facilitator superfamily (MFS) profile domain-containing protein n=1 Tax=Immersiella caudata TaxID=314043 RepID=A0AA39WXU8_9PEZI|nr:hypothetical protein B0T14DRAFT_428062 [Immersiella caudata]
MSSKANPPGRVEARADAHSSSDPETVHAVGPNGYDVDLALACEQRETNMSFWEAVRADKRLIMYTIGFSGTIIMEGYGLATIGNILGLYNFNAKFGKPVFDENHQPTDPTLQTLFGLMAQFGSLIGIMITPYITDKLGYKKTVLVMVALCAALVTIPFFAQSVPVLLAGFFLQGIPWGLFQVVSPTYASEVASVQLRPILTTWNNLCWVIGQFLAAGVIMGFFNNMTDLSFRIPIGISWIFTVILVVVILFAPESPYWYLKRDNVPEARKAIIKLVRKGSPVLAEEKLALMRHTLEQENKQDDVEVAKGFRKYMGLFSNSVDARRTEISCVTWIIQALCGSSLLGWTVIFLNSTGMARDLLFKVNLAGPAAGLLGTIASWWLMQYVGRRAIYFWGCVAMCGLLIGCGFSSFEQSKDKRGLIAGAILAIITCVYDLTLGPICYSIVSEIPSVRRRAATVSAARGMYLLVNLSNYFLTPLMVGEKGVGNAWGWGPKAGFYHAGWCILGAIYTYFRIPETNNLSARGMDILFQNKTSARKFSPEKANELEAEKATASGFRRMSSGESADKATARVVEKR